MSKKFIVDRISEDCIRVYPEKQEEALRQSEVKKRRVTMYDYGAGNGFSITPQNLQKTQAGTIFKIKEMPLVSLHESKNKFFIRVSFTKATLDDARSILLRDEKQWFDYLQQHLMEEGIEALEKAREELEKTKTKTKAKAKKENKLNH